MKTFTCCSVRLVVGSNPRACTTRVLENRVVSTLLVFLIIPESYTHSFRYVGRGPSILGVMQDRNSIIGLSAVVIVVCVIVFVYGRGAWGWSPLAASSASSASVVSFTPLAQGEQSVIMMRVNYRITSAAQLSELWSLVHATSTPPAVDFKTHEVLAVFAGDASNPSIAIAKVEDTNERMVSILLAKPDASCARTNLASHYQIVAVPVTALPLTHEDQVTTADCSN